MNAYGLLTSLAACLCAELTPDGESEPGLCFCGVVPGEIAVADIGMNSDCPGSCGMAWVRLESAYPAAIAGQYQDTANTCGTYLGLDIEVGILRCIEGGENGQPPEPAVLEQISHAQLDDMETMRRAIQCCEALGDLDYLLGTYAPSGPLGLVAGGVWTVSVTL